jgi:hypothetical protein
MLDEATQLCDELGMTGLLERVAALRHSPAEPSAADARFRHEGDFWTIAYEGQMFRLRDVKGLHYIASLLASPGRDLHVLELVSAATGRPVDAHARLAEHELVGSWPSDLGPLLDDRAKETTADGSRSSKRSSRRRAGGGIRSAPPASRRSLISSARSWPGRSGCGAVTAASPRPWSGRVSA